MVSPMKPFGFCLPACFVLSACAIFSGRASTIGYLSTNAFPGIAFTNPVCIVSPPGETNRLFIVEKKGRIVVITNVAAPTRTMFMDISSRVVSAADTTVSGEQGLLGMAFHPGYASNGCFYVFYTANAGAAAGSISTNTLSQFKFAAGNTNQGDPNSETRFVTQYDEANNHNAGDLHFGADGYLYVSLGDEGGAGDSYGNSQRIDHDFFSAIMRIDVDKRPANLTPNPHATALPSLTNYAIPFDNPWVGATNFNGLAVNSNNVRTEFWAVGMRNPWRWSFDPATGELYLGHVGQSALEWVDIVTNGANCGWNFYEGDSPYAGTPPAGFTFTHPLIEYGHTNSRNCIIGGIVYRGSRMPQLAGAYLYADYGSGEVWALRHSGSAVTQNSLLLNEGTSAHISCFGTDPSNNDPLYAALRSGVDSTIERIITTNPVPVINSIALSGTNLIVSGANGAPNGNYYLMSGSNLLQPLSSWTILATNTFDASGNFRLTNGAVGSNPRQFFILQLP